MPQENGESDFVRTISGRTFVSASNRQRTSSSRAQFMVNRNTLGSDTYGSGGLIGAWVWVEYDARKVLSDDTEAHVFTPDGQDVSVTFDLDRLK